jgi:serine/threonine protein kinase
MANQVGQHIDDYRLIRLIGTGSFSEVYLGEHLVDRTLVAVKMLSVNQENWKEFVKEVGTTFRLKHPHIISLLAFGMSTNEIPYLVMDYAPNGTLRQRHPKGTRLPLDTIISYLSPLAQALQYAHDRRVIHRDVKPENVLIGQNGEILLSDFGIAVTAPIEQSLKTQNQGGTIPYMAPEQIRGKPQPASDQYALGIMAYEWLCGIRPFQGSTMWEIIDQHLFQSPPSLREMLPDLPPMVEACILKALAKDPCDRFATVQEFVTTLELACQGETILKPLADKTVSINTSEGKETHSTQMMDTTIQPSTHPPAPQSDPKQHRKGIVIIIPFLLLLLSGSILYAFVGSPLSANRENVGNKLGKVKQPSPTAREIVTPTVDSQATTAAQQAILATQTTAAQQAILATQTTAAEEIAATQTVLAQMTATAQASTPQGLYRTVTSQPPSFSDSLAAQSPRSWNSTSTCAFSDGKYVISTPAGHFQPCYAVGTNLCNLGYQVQMTTLSGDGGGLIFRNTNNNGYRLRVGPDGTYDLVNASYTVTSGSSKAIHQGINATNRLTIIAQGSKIYLYINSQYVTSTIDTAASCGAIGLMAVGFGSAGKAAFSNAEVWLL